MTRLADLLGTLADRFDADAHIPKDPLQFPHRYSDSADVEVVAFLAASLAFGRVAAFSAVLESMLTALGTSPAKALADLDEQTLLRATPKRYRWLAQEDLRALLRAVGATLSAAGSLEAAYVVTGDAWADLGRFLDRLRAEAEQHHPAPTERARALAFLFPRTRAAAACKRQHLFLRWMVRPSHPDLGLWAHLEPSALVMPCDVHTARIGHALGLCSRPDPSRKTAVELTQALRQIDPADPVRFDFALCHLGISGGCKARPIDAVCGDCDLKSACRWW